MEILGLPAHPLVVHGAVVLGPLAGLVSLAYLRPAWRGLLRWPLLVGAVAAMVFLVLAAVSGESLLESREQLRQLDGMHDHEEGGELARNLTLLFGVLAIATTALQRRLHGVLATAAPVATALAAVAMIVVIALAGHSGASLVWG
ncbi:DUF2231 domain-containing protein [Nocardioides bruguierae]|uniref:DUF2231 domain-containing protein n=1 Tax=Nocardioides bruguierae TaxID=2945102 RepID=UPI002020BAE8|nr:DUF2231 domain-containing protein [Nocardioides bruguierae]MCL8024834.1 hypothetical protein [Nocardioides bruguierae]